MSICNRDKQKGTQVTLWKTIIFNIFTAALDLLPTMEAKESKKKRVFICMNPYISNNKKKKKKEKEKKTNNRLIT
jgi:hypothetical protein